MAHRFRDNNELLHSVRSTFMFGSEVVCKIYIVSADLIEGSLWQIMQNGDAVVEEQVGGVGSRELIVKEENGGTSMESAEEKVPGFEHPSTGVKEAEYKDQNQEEKENEKEKMAEKAR
ncbi:hypothetical protein BG015_008001 [Linnemannia schmuckeri]|uniref:Uncharacterized protein n=1 Tax=Linnemannia schmuckeri TaxID=64567 RepID=A0A9P5S0B8_9FUNG|nr:hypothetical protein BG015_008001 [Linnemannia schmuckeri]